MEQVNSHNPDLGRCLSYPQRRRAIAGPPNALRLG
jgi:hypothetical protein